MLLDHSSTSQIRQQAGINHFKRLLLASLHRPGEPQTELVMDKIALQLESSTLDPRTWRNWFNASPPKARSDAISNLDKCAAALEKQGSRARNFYQELMLGGLVRRLLEPTKSKSPESIIRQRAKDYIPTTNLHLHFDAIDVAALTEGNGVVEWETTKAIAAERLMELVDSSPSATNIH